MGGEMGKKKIICHGNTGTENSWFKELWLGLTNDFKPVRVIGYSMEQCVGCFKDSALINSETKLCNDCALDDVWR